MNDPHPVIELKPIGSLLASINPIHLKKHIECERIDNVSFTKKQAEIIRYTVRGRSAGQIAEILGLSKRTIEHCLEEIKLKLHVSNKIELIDKVLDSSNIY